MPDYYALLGLNKTATADQIKKAYRKKAKSKHPDRGGDAAEFKEIQEAYDVLSDPSKRAVYDSGGMPFHSRHNRRPSPAEGFAFHEVMEEFFGGSTYKGRNIQARIEIDFVESYTGCRKTVKIKKKKKCNTCTGNGYTGFKPCSNCSGSGFSQVADAPFEFRTNCQICNGTGKASVVKCGDCLGTGQLPGFQEKAVEINIPQGIDNGMQLRLQGEGEESLKTGGRTGDLIVFVLVKEHPIFVRENINLNVEVPVSYTQLVLGSEIEIPTLAKETIKVKIPAGSQSHTKFRIKGKGVIFNGNIGDLIATVKIEVPKKLEEDYKKTLEQLTELETKYVTPHREKWNKS